jgi:hypothetical protein
VAVSDIAVRGIVRSGTTMLAILEAPNKQSFVARVKDRLLDGTVETIDAGGVVFAAQAESGAATPLRKALRSPGEDVR